MSGKNNRIDNLFASAMFLMPIAHVPGLVHLFDFLPPAGPVFYAYTVDAVAG